MAENCRRRKSSSRDKSAAATQGTLAFTLGARNEHTPLLKIYLQQLLFNHLRY
jgi:hypothetical protein